jgi:hypothetical protein
VALAVLVLVPSAGAVVTTVGSTTVGLQVRSAPATAGGFLPDSEGENFSNNAGNPIISHSNAFVIYWDPDAHYKSEWQQLVDEFMQHVGTESGSASTVFSASTQYTDKANEHASSDFTFRGAYTDTHHYPAKAGCSDPHTTAWSVTCLTDPQIREELQGFIKAHSLPTGMNSVFYLLTPPGVTVCLDETGEHCSDYERPKNGIFGGFQTEVFARNPWGKESKPELEVFGSASYEQSFCSYHGDINPGGLPSGDANTIIYGMIPWTAGTAGDQRIRPSEAEWAYECQDGGFDPSSKPIAGKREKPKEESESEKNTYESDTIEQKEKLVEAKELETPHVQEPEQVGLGWDGTYDYGLADLTANQIAVQQQNIVTDPLLNGWQDSEKGEAGDECRNDFITLSQGTQGVGTGQLSGGVAAVAETKAGKLSNQTLAGPKYYLQDGYNAAARNLGGDPCLTGLTLVPLFTAPNPVGVGEIVGFDGMESEITLNSGTIFSKEGKPEKTYAKYTWTIEPGGEQVTGYAPGAPACEAPWLSPCAAALFHTFTSAGTYQVTLTVEDVGGNKASITHNVTVTTEPPFSGGGGKGSGGSSSSAGSSSASGGGSSHGASPSVLPVPTLAATVLSRSLGAVMHHGIAVRYAVNEQVAGHFEILLSKKLARKLKIGGATATGLPTGSEPQVVIAKALLVTLKGGKSTVHIMLSKHTVERLRRLKKVHLGLRLTARNAALQTPATATLTTAFTLGR